MRLNGDPTYISGLRILLISSLNHIFNQLPAFPVTTILHDIQAAGQRVLFARPQVSVSSPFEPIIAYTVRCVVRCLPSVGLARIPHLEDWQFWRPGR